MKFLLYNDNKNSGVDDETIKTLEDDFREIENLFQRLKKMSAYDYAYLYVRMKHDIEDGRPIVKSTADIIEKGVYYDESKNVDV